MSAPSAGFARPLIAYIAIAFGLAWLVALPLYTSGAGLSHGFFIPISVGIMATPMIAALIVVFWIQRYPLMGRDGQISGFQRLGLSFTRPYKRFFGYFVLAWLGMIVLVFLALVTSALFGVYRFDFANLSGLSSIMVEQALAQNNAEAIEQIPATVHEVLVAQIISIVFFSLLNIIPALGEEIGWRGWLMPHLSHLGVLPMIVFSGIAWGLWHLPLLLLGYNYPGANPIVAAGAMTGMCTLVGALLYWVRLRTDSVWPAAIGHGALNAAAGLAFVLGAAPLIFNTTLATILGVAGWIVPGILVAIIWLTGGFAPTKSASAPKS
ncbi:CAAX protease self-immunity [Bowdeniella nasicola]|uniref:CAAX protease self-immunity n=1 Tax=Bowdeniella nasicola TaxID=208480 RepID=A0A1H3ZJ56_9ACTO|nr:CPBP family glutamic-type intramembrane protease [Bowdeniella nasicola]SEA23763.1 CAAX protease self-immunity [Bowdeniella nasicola]